MIQRIQIKLKAQAGESIGETLVALLISAIALLMLAGAVSSGTRVVNNSKNVLEKYYTVNNAVAKREASVTLDGETVPVKDDGFITITMPGLNSAGIAKAIYWKNEQLSGTTVIAYTYSAS